MRLLDYLERKLGRFAVPQVTAGLIGCQVLVYFASLAVDGAGGPNVGRETIIGRLELISSKVLNGEVWRLVTFLVVPPSQFIIMAIFFWYLFYLMGTALELHWGTFRYNVYLLVGYIATVAVSFIVPELPATNAYLQGSVFLAFAHLFPDFQMFIFFILRVKIKWLALITWIFYGFVAVFGDWLNRLMVLASVCNFLLSFSNDILDRVRTGKRSMDYHAKLLSASAREQPYLHRCEVCGVTDRMDRNMEFRYCSKCTGHHGYCMEHLRDHQHITTEDPSTANPK
jgi:hypothetical protein